jgi:hypothetical protein
VFQHPVEKFIQEKELRSFIGFKTIGYLNRQRALPSSKYGFGNFKMVRYPFIMRPRHASAIHNNGLRLSIQRRKAAAKRKALRDHRELPNPRRPSFSGHRSEAILALLEDLSTVLSGYPRVTGMLYKILDDSVEVIVVAPKPMTRPMQTILEGIASRLTESIPEVNWHFRALPIPPANPSGYSTMAIALQ